MSYEKEVKLINRFNEAVTRLFNERGPAFTSGFLEAQVRIMLTNMPSADRQAVVDAFVNAATAADIR